jgi:hypothetical protein
MARKHSSWKPGDIFGIPLGRDEYGLGQILSHEKNCMDSVFCCFSNVIARDSSAAIPPIGLSDLISVQITTRDSLDKGIWSILGSSNLIDVAALHPIESLRANRYVGAKITGSGAMQKFVLAYHGRSPWDEYFDPLYFDKLLVEGLVRPASATFKAAAS